MKYLFDDWEGFKKELKSKYILLFLDFDGTLVPTEKPPEKMLVSQDTKDFLKKLSTFSNSHVKSILLILVFINMEGAVNFPNITFSAFKIPYRFF